MRSYETLDGSGAPVADDIPVLIVGGGPCGLLQAYLLAQLSVKTLVIERYQQRLAAPKAHALSPRSLEICRQFYLDVNAIRAKGTSRNDAFWVNFVTSLAGQHVARLPYERMDEAVLDDTPEMIHNIPQPEFEQIVMDQLLRTRLSEVRKNVSFSSCYETSDAIFTTVEDRANGGSYTIRSRFLIGADGARSRVRQSLGVKSSGEETEETMMTIHFSADLRPICSTKVGILHWIMEPSVSGFIIGYDLGGNQVLICNFDSQKFPANMWDEQKCREVLRLAIGSDITLNVRSWRPWTFKSSIAEQYRVGKAFLVGDAAHSFPPTGGLGLNSGLADVHNLAYKIAAVLQGWASPAIFNSYQKDRQLVAQINAQQSIKNGKKIFGLLKALGTTNVDIDQARINLMKSINEQTSRKEIDREIQEQQEHFDNLELHIGYVYGSTIFPPHASHYSPKYVAGARLPHAWIRPLQKDLMTKVIPVDLSYVSGLTAESIEARQWSTLDMCRFDSFTLIQPDTEIAHQRTEAALRDIDNMHLSATKNKGRPSHVLWPVFYGRDFDALNDGTGRNFVELAGLNTAQCGGILVRPDQHILLVLDASTTAAQISGVIKEHLYGTA